jgi:hypothetical protein
MSFAAYVGNFDLAGVATDPHALPHSWGRGRGWGLSVTVETTRIQVHAAKGTDPCSGHVGSAAPDACVRALAAVGEAPAVVDVPTVVGDEAGLHGAAQGAIARGLELAPRGVDAVPLGDAGDGLAAAVAPALDLPAVVIVGAGREVEGRERAGRDVRRRRSRVGGAGTPARPGPKGWGLVGANVLSVTAAEDQHHRVAGGVGAAHRGRPSHP